MSNHEDSSQPLQIQAATPAPNPATSGKWAATGVCVLLAGMVWVVFGQTLRHEFVNYDDDKYVYENPETSRGLSLEGIAWAFTRAVGDNWHPLTTISHMSDSQVYKLQPWGHHLTNVLLHGIATILLFLALRKMTGAPRRCAFVAAVFAIHPLHVESVAWVSERKDVLSGVFFMLTLWAYAHYVQKTASRARYFAVIALFALGLMCKPTLVTLPFVLLLLDYWPLHRFRDQPAQRRIFSILWHLIVEKVPLFVLSGCLCVATLLIQKRDLGMVEKLSFPGQIANALVSYMVYLTEMIYPARLAVFYPYPANYWPVWKVLLAILLLLSISTSVFVSRRKYPFLQTGWLWYVGMLVPMIGLIQVGGQAHADRYTYLSQIGLYIAVAWLATDFCGKMPHRSVILGAAGLIVVAALMRGAWVQTSYWQNSQTLWNRAIAVTNGNVVAHVDLGNDLQGKGELDKAIGQYRTALEIKTDSSRIQPDYAKAHYNLGNALQKKGLLDPAIAQYREALEIMPGMVDAHINLGAVLRQKGEMNEAIAHFQKALEIQPDSANAHNNLGLALLDGGAAEEAIAHFQKALDIQPGYAEAFNNLGLAFLREGKAGEAITPFQKAIAINPAYAEAQYNLGLAMQRKGQAEEAIAHYQKALEIKPGFPAALNNLAYLLATCPEASLRDGAKALKLALEANQSAGGEDPGVLGTLAAAYAETGDFSKAVEASQRAVDLATSQSNAVLTGLLRSQLALYQAHKPLRAETPGKQSSP